MQLNWAAQHNTLISSVILRRAVNQKLGASLKR